jgi:hypothetical protein
MDVLCRLVEPAPVGTNLGLVHLTWMMLSGRLLTARGAVIPGLDALGLPPEAVRRAWQALGHGAWDAPTLIARWQHLVDQEHQWQPHVHADWRPVAVDVTDFPRPRLQDCPTKHYEGKTGKTSPAIPIGLVVRVGQVGSQRLGLPTAMVRVPSTNPTRQAHAQALVRQAVASLRPDEVAIFDRGFLVSLLQAEGCPRFVVRLLKHFTARRALLPAYKGYGRRPKRGQLVRPLARTRQGRLYEATPPDRAETWQDGEHTLRADWWTDLVLPDAEPSSPTFDVVAIYDPRYEDPLLLALSVKVPGSAAHGLYHDRWPVEQVPLAAKQMIGGHRQFVHEPETRQRLPELLLLAGSMLTYLAATGPAVPTGFWDRKPQPTPGRLRRVLAAGGFPEWLVPVGRIRKKASLTAHLPKGHFGQRRRHLARPPARAASVTGN